jgi:hypothetical protein
LPQTWQEHLIELVRVRPSLYDKANRDYYDKKSRPIIGKILPNISSRLGILNSKTEKLVSFSHSGCYNYYPATLGQNI